MGQVSKPLEQLLGPARRPDPDLPTSNEQPDRRRDKRSTPCHAQRPPRNEPGQANQSDFLVVLPTHRKPRDSSRNPENNAYGRATRGILPKPGKPTHHPKKPPRMGRRNHLERTPPHHPLQQHMGLTPKHTICPFNPCFGLVASGKLQQSHSAGACLLVRPSCIKYSH